MGAGDVRRGARRSGGGAFIGGAAWARRRGPSAVSPRRGAPLRDVGRRARDDRAAAEVVRSPRPPPPARAVAGARGRHGADARRGRGGAGRSLAGPRRVTACPRCGFADVSRRLLICPRCALGGVLDEETTDWPELTAAGLTIESELGAGGMGRVFRARAERLGRDVAVKVLRPESAADPDFRARFAREARTLARLEHPGIVAIHDFGTSPGGDAYLVMQL